MELFYVVLFMAAAATAGVLEWTKGREVDGGDKNKEFQRFRHNYVLVYGLMMGGDLLPAACTKVLLLAALAVLSPYLMYQKAMHELQCGHQVLLLQAKADLHAFITVDCCRHAGLL